VVEEHVPGRYKPARRVFAAAQASSVADVPVPTTATDHNRAPLRGALVVGGRDDAQVVAQLQQALAEAKAGIDGLQGAADWQALTRLPAESFPSAVQRRLAESQTIGQLAVQNQAAFASGVQQALVHWQHAVTRSGAEQPTAAAVPDWLKPWAALLPQQGTTAVAQKE
jgi:hypothetical protein